MNNDLLKKIKVHNASITVLGFNEISNGILSEYEFTDRGIFETTCNLSQDNDRYNENRRLLPKNQPNTILDNVLSIIERCEDTSKQFLSNKSDFNHSYDDWGDERTVDFDNEEVSVTINVLKKNKHRVTIGFTYMYIGQDDGKKVNKKLETLFSIKFIDWRENLPNSFTVIANDASHSDLPLDEITIDDIFDDESNDSAFGFAIFKR